ncbi:plasmid mobilization relaxosome protein MobC [Blautia sp.]|uniref:plasmid mobilization relaxosome protein MobC n=1 Tax=Blautia sp. TaxID=1955243 RepID=UPI00257D570E|nr:plasmid mobilization relaxosome protein MobC [Blautia sp.]
MLRDRTYTPSSSALSLNSISIIIYGNPYNIKAFTKELSTIGRNINQIAKRVNAGGPVYQADMDEIRERLDEIWQLQRRILSSQR